MHCLAPVQIKKTHSGTTEQEGPMTLDRPPESWHKKVMFWHRNKEISFKIFILFLLCHPI